MRQYPMADSGLLEHIDLLRQLIIVGQSLRGVELCPHPAQLRGEHLATGEHDALLGGFFLQCGVKVSFTVLCP